MRMEGGRRTNFLIQENNKNTLFRSPWPQNGSALVFRLLINSKYDMMYFSKDQQFHRWQKNEREKLP